MRKFVLFLLLTVTGSFQSAFGGCEDEFQARLGLERYIKNPQEYVSKIAQRPIKFNHYISAMTQSEHAYYIATVPEIIVIPKAFNRDIERIKLDKAGVVTSMFHRQGQLHLTFLDETKTPIIKIVDVGGKDLNQAFFGRSIQSYSLASGPKPNSIRTSFNSKHQQMITVQGYTENRGNPTMGELLITHMQSQNKRLRNLEYETYSMLGHTPKEVVQHNSGQIFITIDKSPTIYKVDLQGSHPRYTEASELPSFVQTSENGAGEFGQVFQTTEAITIEGAETIERFILSGNPDIAFILFTKPNNSNVYVALFGVKSGDVYNAPTPTLYR